MEWCSYSRNSDFDKPRSIVHRCDDDCGGFEYEYCFAECEYRFAEYDTNRKTQPLERSFSSRTLLCSSQNTNCECFPTSSPGPFSSPGRRRGVAISWGIRSKHHTNGFCFLCVLVSLREPTAPLARPQRASYGDVLRNGLVSPPLEGDHLLLKNHISAY